MSVKVRSLKSQVEAHMKIFHLLASLLLDIGRFVLTLWVASLGRIAFIGFNLL